ncbi:MAG: hypothetical protein ACXU82_17055 [Caulobacteraceae bacterium]
MAFVLLVQKSPDVRGNSIFIDAVEARSLDLELLGPGSARFAPRPG